MLTQPNAHPSEILTIWIEAFNARDLPRICSLYASDAVLWGTFSSSLITSPHEVQAYFARVFDPATQASAELQGVQLQSVGATAIASGAYLLKASIAGEHQALPARFTIVFHQAHGSWVIVNHHSSLTP